MIVLGLARGGVPIGNAIARALNVSLDVLVVRKLGMPGHEERAMGAIASGMVRVLNPDVRYGPRRPGKWGDASDNIETAVSSRIWSKKPSF